MKPPSPNPSKLFFFLSLSLLLHAVFFCLVLLPRFSHPSNLAGNGYGIGIDVIGSDAHHRGPSRPPSQRATGIGSSLKATGTGLGDGGTDPVLTQIRILIEQAKRYPLLAQRSSLQGKALVHFQIDDSGQARDISLVTSSSSKILDDEALATIRRAAPYPPYKDPLSVWIRFEINN
ncbi:MAG: energy transducer TonB [Deltaproteobacteria bacterium]|nr:energy transducer TonB [Deltaproteobacteria bacterium]